jgi:hypothetical protein
MSFSTRKKILVGVSTLGVLLLAGAAIAYFTASGAGTGTATVGTSTALTLHGSTSGSLYPGASTTVTFTADNPNSGKVEVGTIHLASIKACVGAGSTWTGSACSNSGTEATGCETVETGATDGNTADFWMADVPVNAEVNSGSGQSITPTGTLMMNDLSTTQDACKNANLTLNLTS